MTPRLFSFAALCIAAMSAISCATVNRGEAIGSAAAEMSAEMSALIEAMPSYQGGSVALTPDGDIQATFRLAPGYDLSSVDSVRIEAFRASARKNIAARLRAVDAPDDQLISLAEAKATVIVVFVDESGRALDIPVAIDKQ